MRYCHVESCQENDIPIGIKGAVPTKKSLNGGTSDKYKREVNEDCTSHHTKLDYLNKTISAKAQKDMELWDAYDDALDNFCDIDENDEDAEYVDLLLNPERYTGYVDGLTDPKGKWGPNLQEFLRRFSPETTNGEGPHWLRNLYFIYMLEMRALAKAAPYLVREEYYTGNDSEDWETQMAVKDLLNVVKQFPEHFDETTMFRNTEQADKLKYEFKQHFRNITRIMDCVGCDKCRLWGKLQTQGLGTALKILFSGKFDYINEKTSIDTHNKKEFQLHRNEIVSLLNALGRLSNSIYKLDDFRLMLR
ncbi:hypothetical protein NQ314_016499 [Rhamnusium bicolor]|uniref:Uncharacterized protein n=1 Tax=Rhamnusium bicolor TaxID=1586634 RepID=A0AAV8WWR4_9CUCU|nr:hypothetical protein NQ314_016499 [Rhamnusium bicolor]